jgi:type VI secretion system FHA domain protein
MLLELQLIKQPAGELPPQKSCQFVEQGGTIGRAEHCEFVLADQTKSISKAHALVHYRDGAYFLTDVSSNGVFVNNDPIPIGKGNTKQILSGDQFQMGDYVLQANIGDSVQVLQNRKSEQDEIEKLLSNKDDLSELLMEEAPKATNYTTVNKLHNAEQSIDHILDKLSPGEATLDLNEIPSEDGSDLLAELVGGVQRSTNHLYSNNIAVTSSANSEQLAEQVFTELLMYISPEKFSAMFGQDYTEANFRAFCEMLSENKELIVAGVLDKLNRK